MVAANTADFIVVGGGVVGSAIALGLARAGVSVIMLDEGDAGFSASRGNYGLIWLQGKGRGCPAYVSWLRQSAEKWQEFSEELKDISGIDVGYKATGGVSLALTGPELQNQIASLKQIASESDSGFEYSVLEPRELRKIYPLIGERVEGGIFCPYDAIVDPLRLLYAQHEAFRRLGGRYYPAQKVAKISRLAEGYQVNTQGLAFVSRSIVVAAGLGTEALARELDCNVPLRPIQGQLLITEKTTPMFEIPTLHARQMPSGGFLLGLSHDDRGFKTSTDFETIRNVSARCVAAFPFLENLNVVRSWASLRVMTPDGWPIYAASRSAPGAFAVASHSGITLAAAHVMYLAESLIRGSFPETLALLSDERFNV